jgi:hypothetical protein
MKLNRLETHDRLEHLIKDQSANIFQGADDCMKRNPLSLQMQEKSPYVYLFAHPRTADDGVTKVMYWQPRLTKPPAQENSYLFRAISNTDTIEIKWLIPPQELWKQYTRNNVTENELVLWSINQLKYNKEDLEKPEHDDLSDKRISEIYRDIYANRERKKWTDGSSVTNATKKQNGIYP